MKKILTKLNFIIISVIQLIIICLLIKKFGNYKILPQVFNHNIIAKNFCDNYIVLNYEIIELLDIAAEQDIKLFISEPQRLLKYLNQQELELLDECDNSSIIEANFEPNKIILGYFGSNFTINQSVRHFIFSFITRLLSL
jgi:hypothetical protein